MAQTLQNTKKPQHDHCCAENRFTELPDAVIHHIFSFLDDNDMARTMFLSKRCKQVCLSSPYIKFSNSNTKPFDNSLAEHIYQPGECDKSRCKDFKSFIRKFLTERGDNVIHSFKLHWVSTDCPCHASGRPLLDYWIRQVVRCRIQELYLNINLAGRREKEEGSYYTFPYPPLGCKYLKVVEIDLHDDNIFMPPTVLASLETLSLNASNYVGEISLGRWISTCCPSLKKLTLVSVNKLKLINRSIEDLTIESTSFSSIDVLGDNLKTVSMYFPKSLTNYSDLILQAPNLQVIKWEGHLPRRMKFGEFGHLIDATLNTCRAYNVGNSPEYGCKNFVKLLKCATTAKILRTNISMAEVMFVERDVQLLFENSDELHIRNHRESFWENHVPIIDDFIARFPKLGSLTVERKSKLICHDSWCWAMKKILELQIRSYNKVNQERENDRSLVRYLLQNIDGLKSLTAVDPSSYKRNLTTFIEKKQ